MKLRTLALAMLVASTVAIAQSTSQYINTANSCSYAGESSPIRVLAFASDSAAEAAVKRIVDASGLSQNFQIRAAGVANAAASIDGERRFLLYNQTFMHDMQRATGSEWAALSVMAHEVGHHLNGHPLSPNRDPKYEIDADYYSGFILQKLGATLAQAQSAVNYLPSTGASRTHPAKHDRLAAIASGWTRSCNESNCNRQVTSVTDRADPKPDPKPPKKDGPNSCDYANDGVCDEPANCSRGTDTADCKERKTGPNSCEYSRDGSCDEPDICDRGTDTADCRVRPTQTFCCDAWGRKWCPMVVQGAQPGSVCFCNGIPGSGFVCE